MSESGIKARILLALGRRADLMIWNNATGVGRSMDGQRVIKFGLPGSGDILGVHAVKITPEMVGETIGQAVAIETKTSTGEQQANQEKFEKAFKQRGGKYIVARSTEDAEKEL